MVTLTPLSLYTPQNEPMVPSGQEVGRVSERVRTLFTTVNILQLPGIESRFFGQPARTTLTELTRFTNFDIRNLLEPETL